MLKTESESYFMIADIVVSRFFAALWLDSSLSRSFFLSSPVNILHLRRVPTGFRACMMIHHSSHRSDTRLLLVLRLARLHFAAQRTAARSSSSLIRRIVIINSYSRTPKKNVSLRRYVLQKNLSIFSSFLFLWNTSSTNTSRHKHVVLRYYVNTIRCKKKDVLYTQ